MKLRAVGLLSLMLAACLSSALVAQEEGRGRRGGPGGGPGGPGGGPGGPGGRGGMFGGGGMSMGGALDLINLLRMEEVQKELEMSGDAAKAVRDMMGNIMPDMRALFGASETERAKMLKESSTKAQEVLDEVLSPEHQKRLLGLYAQQNGFRSVANELVAKEIGLDEAGIAKVKEAAAKAGEDARAKMRGMRESGGEFDFTKMREMMEAATKEAEKAVQDVLTDDQEKALETLKGEKFTFPERPAFGGGRGGPGGPGGDRGGDRGGRGRPGSDNN